MIAEIPPGPQFQYLRDTATAANSIDPLTFRNFIDVISVSFNPDGLDQHGDWSDSIPPFNLASDMVDLAYIAMYQPDYAPEAFRKMAMAYAIFSSGTQGSTGLAGPLLKQFADSFGYGQAYWDGYTATVQAMALESEARRVQVYEILSDDSLSWTEQQQRLAVYNADLVALVMEVYASGFYSIRMGGRAKVSLPAAVTGGPKYGNGWLLKGNATNTGLPRNGVDYDTISTAGHRQSAIPRDLNEQALFNGVRSNPSSGRILPGMNNDTRFLASDGFQKMEMTHRLPNGSNVTVHYQYNSNTGLAYDIKVVTPQRVPPVLQPGPTVTE